MRLTYVGLSEGGSLCSHHGGHVFKLHHHGSHRQQPHKPLQDSWPSLVLVPLMSRNDKRNYNPVFMEKYD